ncbi:MAG: NAD(P)/FAD-dependent oxidoreductase [Actinomycetales bacterium]
MTTDYASLSLWHDTADEDWDAPGRRPLTGHESADVAIVGAGFTGLWTAYYLLQRNPGLRVVVLEAEVAGFGASGRNGGWCSALFPQGTGALAARYGRAQALAMHRAMTQTVDEVGEVAQREGIDCGYRKGGTVVVARTPVQLRRAQSEVAEARQLGLSPDDLELLDAEQTRRHVGIEAALASTFTPHCARVHPARLVRGLARAVERLGATLHEHSPVTGIRPRDSSGLGRVTTESGRVSARHVVRATEGYTSSLPGQRRTLAPVYSLMIATAPLPEAFWRQAGLEQGETFSEHRHLIVYGQRTADDRFAFGGRGAPYHWASRVRPEYDREPRVFDGLERALHELFPAAAGVPITHGWGGALGIPRDWMAGVGTDETTGIAWAGGYVGDGVGTTNLAGRTLADLITGTSSELTSLPWVGHRSRRWEPEPLRWIGVNAGLQLARAADAEEALTRRPSRLAPVLSRLTGGH